LWAAFHPISELDSALRPIREVRSPSIREVRSPSISEVRSPSISEVRSPSISEVRSPSISEVRSPSIRELDSAFHPSRQRCSQLTVLGQSCWLCIALSDANRLMPG
jgi:hypothetical protein